MNWDLIEEDDDDDSEKEELNQKDIEINLYVPPVANRPGYLKTSM